MICFSKNSRKTAFQRIANKREYVGIGYGMQEQVCRLDTWIRGNSWEKKRTWNKANWLTDAPVRDNRQEASEVPT